MFVYVRGCDVNSDVSMHPQQKRQQRRRNLFFHEKSKNNKQEEFSQVTGEGWASGYLSLKTSQPGTFAVKGLDTTYSKHKQKTQTQKKKFLYFLFLKIATFGFD